MFFLIFNLPLASLPKDILSDFMKRLYFMLTAFILAAVPFALVNCEDVIPAGLDTTVRGQVYDEVKRKPLAGVNVVLWNCITTISDWQPLQCNVVVDSVRTDADGKYKMNFVTDGKADQYWIKVERDLSFWSEEGEKVRPGVSSFITLYAREYNFVKVRLEIDNNSIGSIYMETPGGNQAVIPQHTRDTIVYGRVWPMTTNYIEFRVYDRSIGDDTRRSTDTLNIDLSDTTYLTKKIIDPATWPVHP
jgi:hypothetical protein